jgi:hypothetical protein
VATDGQLNMEAAPLVRIVAGQPDDDELAALVVALRILAARPPQAPTSPKRPRRRSGSSPPLTGWRARSAARPAVPLIP